MIRFINLTGQIFIDDDELYFAWYDTVTDTFLTFSGIQTWDSWEDFVRDYNGKDLKRFHRLMPKMSPKANPSDPSLPAQENESLLPSRESAPPAYPRIEPL